MQNTVVLKDWQVICIAIYLQFLVVNFAGVGCIEWWWIVGMSSIAAVCCSLELVLASKCEIDRIYQYIINV